MREWHAFEAQKMSVNITGDRRRDTAIFGILVALAVMAFLAGAEFVFERWVSPNASGGPFFSSPSSAPAPGAPAPAVSSTTGSGSTGGPAAAHRSAPTSNPAHPARSHATPRKPAANAVAQAHPKVPPNAGNPSATPEASRSSNAPATSPQDARVVEENLRATEDAAAHLVALEREELDHLSDRNRAMNDRVDALQRQQPAPDQQRRTDLAFSQQRIQSYLNQADNALRIADVRVAQKYMNLAKAELEKLGKLLAR
jgi:hypothetical protein